MDVQQILEKADLVRLAERAGARLRRSGGGYRGACPLHGGDNPTAFVIYTGDDGRQRWYCHTHCGGGDAIDFVRRWRNLPNGSEGFIEALRILSEILGIPFSPTRLSPEEAQRAAARRERERRRQGLLKVAAGYYQSVLWSPAGGQGLEYARGRGWSDETIKEIGLGFSDGKLLAHLRQQEADLDLACEVGLLHRRDDGTLVDAIPPGYLVYVHRYYGQITYMSGRATFTDDPARKARNLHAPKRPFWALGRRRTPLIVVEGQACAITAWQWGYNAVALCGVNLDERETKAIQGYPGIYLALDDDAQDKIGRVADRLGPLTMVVSDLPAHDLNDWLREGGTREDLAEALKRAKPWIEVAIERAGAAPAYELEDHLDHLAQLVAQLPPGTRGKYIREICDRRRISTRRDFRRLLAQYDRSQASADGFEVRDGRLTYYGDPLCNFTARITHELIQDDGMNPPTVLFTIEGRLDNGERLEPIEVKAEEFDSLRWIGRHWGARPIVYVPPGKVYLLRRAIQEASRADLKRERVHTFTGWSVIEGRRLFLTATGGLGADGLDPTVRVDLGSNNLNRYALPEPPSDLRNAIEASIEFLNLAPFCVTLPIWAAMYAAPLSPIRTLNAVLWVYGITQSGKSTLTHLALAHFGPTFIQGHEYRAPKDWTSTVTDLERAMFVIKDAPIIIDDYAPAHSGAAEARQMARKAHYVVRSVGNRSARGRANADLSERQQRPPRGLVIATAENPLVGQSVVGRMIYVPVEAGQIIRPDSTGETPLDIAQQKAMEGLYAQAMAGYIAWLARRWNRLEEELPQEIEHHSRVARGLFPPGQSRLTDYYGILVVAVRLALEYAADHEAITEQDVETLWEIYRLELVELLRSQSERVAAQSPAVKFFQALNDLLAQEKVYFAPRRDPSFIPPDRAELIGWYDDEKDRVYLLTNVALAIVKDYWQALDERFDTLADALRRELWQHGYVAERDGRNIEKKPYINRDVGRVRVLVLDARVLREKAGLILSGERAEEGIPDLELV